MDPYEGYYIGQPNGIQDKSITSKLSDLWTGAKTTVSGWFGKSPVETQDLRAEGVNLDFVTDAYPSRSTTSKSAVNVDRIATQMAKDPSGQSGECSWFNVYCKAKNGISSVTSKAGEVVSSTLTKVIVIIVLVAFIGLIAFTYAQAKGEQLAGIK